MEIDLSHRQLLALLQDLHNQILELLSLPRSSDGDARLTGLIKDYERLAKRALKLSKQP